MYIYNVERVIKKKVPHPSPHSPKSGIKKKF
jgi:hypothetical protein